MIIITLCHNNNIHAKDEAPQQKKKKIFQKGIMPWTSKKP